MGGSLTHCRLIWQVGWAPKTEVAKELKQEKAHSLLEQAEEGVLEMPHEPAPSSMTHGSEPPTENTTAPWLEATRQASKPAGLTKAKSGLMTKVGSASSLLKRMSQSGKSDPAGAVSASGQ